MQVLQVFFLQDLQDLALNLARLALKMKIFARTEKSCSDLQDFNHIKIILQFFLQVLARSVQHFSIFARKAPFLVQVLQDFMQDLASLARKILARLAYFLQDGFYWILTCILPLS